MAQGWPGSLTSKTEELYFLPFVKRFQLFEDISFCSYSRSLGVCRRGDMTGTANVNGIASPDRDKIFSLFEFCSNEKLINEPVRVSGTITRLGLVPLVFYTRYVLFRGHIET